MEATSNFNSIPRGRDDGVRGSTRRQYTEVKHVVHTHTDLRATGCPIGKHGDGQGASCLLGGDGVGPGGVRRGGAVYELEPEQLGSAPCGGTGDPFGILVAEVDHLMRVWKCVET